MKFIQKLTSRLLIALLCSLLASTSIQAMQSTEDEDDQAMQIVDNEDDDEGSVVLSHNDLMATLNAHNAQFSTDNNNNPRGTYGSRRSAQFSPDDNRRGTQLNNDPMAYGTSPYRYKELPRNLSPMTAAERSRLNTLKKVPNLGLEREHAADRILLAKALDEGSDQAFINRILKKASDRDDYYLMKKALQLGANPNTKEDDGEPIIMNAKSVDIVKLLVDSGASMKEAVLPFKNTVLHAACGKEYDPKVLEYYIQNAGLDINSENAFRETPLHVWVEALRVISTNRLPDAQKKLTLLLAAGADPMHKNMSNKAPLYELKSIITNEENSPFRDSTNLQAYQSYLAQLRAIMNEKDAANEAKKIELMKNQKTCPICTEDFESSDDITALPCNHIFHTICIDKWLETSNTCPICRRPAAAQ